MRLALLFVFIGCSSPQQDPELVRLKTTLDLWESGVAYLDKGETLEAQVAFREALKSAPDDVILKVWWARSLAASGHQEAAVRVLDSVLLVEPSFAEARYNKAAYLTRMGKVDEAAPVLKRALEDGAATSYDVLEDPDFRNWVDDPAFSFLPQTSMVVQLEGPSGSVFLGDEFGVTFRVFGASRAPVSTDFREVHGPIELVSVNEDQVHSTVGLVRELEFRYRVVAPGRATIGPVKVSSANRSGAVAETQVVALAPPSFEISERHLDLALFKTPSEVLGDHKIPQVWSDASRVYVSSQPTDRVVFGELRTEIPIKYVFKERGQPKWVVHSWPKPRTDQMVDVVRNGELLLRSTGDSASRPNTVAQPVHTD